MKDYKIYDGKLAPIYGTVNAVFRSDPVMNLDKNLWYHYSRAVFNAVLRLQT